MGRYVENNYRDGKQYGNIQDLHSEITVAWSSITPENLLKYANGMQKRMVDVLKKEMIKSINKFSFFKLLIF